MLDVDDWAHLPPAVYVPVLGGSTGNAVTVELREMIDTRLALLAYSTAAHLAVAFGAGQSALRLLAGDLPRLRRRLRFHAILLDVSAPAESASAVTAPLSLTIDQASGEPMVFVPSRSFRRADREVQLELQRTADGKLALMAYSSRASLSEACGPNQYFVTFPVGQLAVVQRESGADSVLVDMPLPARLRH